MTKRNPLILSVGVLVLLFVTTRAGAAGEETATSSCDPMVSPAADQSSPEADVSEAASEDVALACMPEATDLARPVIMPIEDLLDRAAICRLLPECWTNADCDAQCGGTGLGRCAHSRCPPRFCRCR